jgi:MFS family permease
VKVGRTVAVALVATATGTLPVFMLGGLSVQVGAELGFDARALGVATTVFFAVSAIGSTPAGRWVQRAGPYPGLVTTAVLSAAALVGIAGLATSYAVLVAFLVVAGIGNAAAQPAANQLLASEIPTGRQGLFFGIKQAAVPVATLLAGASVPVIGLTIGWRWAFAVVAVGAVSLPLLAAPQRGRGPIRARSSGTDEPVLATGGVEPLPTGQIDRLPLLVLATGATLAAAAVNTLGVFTVTSAVLAGFSPSGAGVVLAGGSALGIAARVVVGWDADRRADKHLLRVAVMLVLGSVGFVLLGVAATPGVFLIGTVLAFASGWGWNGLFTFAVVRNYPNSAAAATGITQTGLWLGGMIGPLVFGLVATAVSYRAAWILGGTALVAAAGVSVLGRHLVIRAREARVTGR